MLVTKSHCYTVVFKFISTIIFNLFYYFDTFFFGNSLKLHTIKVSQGYAFVSIVVLVYNLKLKILNFLLHFYLNARFYRT